MSFVNAHAQARFDALRDLNFKVPRVFEFPVDDQGQPLKISDFFGVNTFDIFKMKEKLPKDVFSQIIASLESSKPLDAKLAGLVAHAMKEWALAKGVTHYCHWFQPQTGITAEKHDAFLSFDDRGAPIEKFSGSELIQGESDASSFPSGGMRSTFEARGYTAWDPSSPVFIMEHENGKTLCIPSVFMSYHGESLDEKTGLLRSIEFLSQKTCDLLHVLGYAQVKRVIPTLGVEQEYFLVDRALYSLRPDLLMTGRSLVGQLPPKGQQLEDHYFGSIPARAQAFMCESEFELYKLGVPVKTRHNEVAPGQFELAPIFEEANRAVDHNQLIMEVLKRVGIRHGFQVLFHEKPFAGINGSGKHHNWSLMVASVGSRSVELVRGQNLLSPGKTSSDHLRFLTILLGVLLGVQKHAGLLRAGIASAGNDHRLGANEAPPAILSVFLGNFLDSFLNELEKGAGSDMSVETTVLKLGVAGLPWVMKDNTDRNRTSPFAFTGNRFEFRAVGSAASCAFPTTLLNTVIGDGFSELTEALKAKRKKSKELQESDILEVLRNTVKQTRSIRFEGNNYSGKWLEEAEQRHLPHLRKTPEALAQFLTPSTQKLLTESGVFEDVERVSRFHVHLERYLKDMWIELNTLKLMVDVQILPAVYAYHGSLSQAAMTAKSVGVPAPQLELLNRLSLWIHSLQEKRNHLDRVASQIEECTQEEQKARIFAEQGTAVMGEVRYFCDILESAVSDTFWPLPKYFELLFLI